MYSKNRLPLRHFYFALNLTSYIRYNEIIQIRLNRNYTTFVRLAFERSTFLTLC